MPECKSLNNSQRHLDDIIEHKCRKLGKSGASKGSALHLAQWMRGQLGGSTGPLTPDDEPEPEVWSTEMLRRRSEQLQILGVVPVRNESRCEEFEISDTERSASRSTSDSQVTVRSGGPEHQVAVCRKCHKTCLANSAISPQTPNDPDNDLSNLEEDDTDYDEKWGPLMLMGMSTLGTTVGFGTRAIMDPFSPTEVPLISVLPPTPDTLPRSSSFQWDDGDLALTPRITNTSPGLEVQHNEDNRTDYLGTFVEEDEDSGENSGHDDEEHPYRSLSSATCMKRYGTLASLEILEGDELEDAAEDATDSEEDGEDWESDGEEHTNDCPGEIQPQFEVVTQSLRGWTARAGSFVAEKMALFERLGEDSRAAAAFLDSNKNPLSTRPRQLVPETRKQSS